MHLPHRKRKRIGLLHKHFDHPLTASGANGRGRFSGMNSTGIHPAHSRLIALTALPVDHAQATRIQHVAITVGRGGDVCVFLLRGMLRKIEGGIDPPPQFRGPFDAKQATIFRAGQGDPPSVTAHGAAIAAFTAESGKIIGCENVNGARIGILLCFI